MFKAGGHQGNSRLDLKDVTLLLHDTEYIISKPGPTRVVVSDNTLSWLERELKDSETVIVMGHYPVIEESVGPLHASRKNTALVENAKELLGLIDSYEKAVGIFTAHTHQSGTMYRVGKCPIFSVEPFSRTFNGKVLGNTGVSTVEYKQKGFTLSYENVSLNKFSS